MIHCLNRSNFIADLTYTWPWDYSNDSISVSFILLQSALVSRSNSMFICCFLKHSVVWGPATTNATKKKLSSLPFVRSEWRNSSRLWDRIYVLITGVSLNLMPNQLIACLSFVIQNCCSEKCSSWKIYLQCIYWISVLN